MSLFADNMSVSDRDNDNIKDNIGDDIMPEEKKQNELVVVEDAPKSEHIDEESLQGEPADEDAASDEAADEEATSDEAADENVTPVESEAEGDVSEETLEIPEWELLEVSKEDGSESGEAEEFDFDRSLDEFRKNDMPLTDVEKERKKRNLISSAIRACIMLLSISLFGYSLFLVAKTLYDYKRTNDLYDELAKIIFDDDYLYDEEREENQLTYEKRLKASSATPGFYESMTAGVTEDTSYTVESSTYNEEFEKMKVKLHNLSLQNDELYGWITVENTNINYPIMQHSDNDYYLDYAYSGVALPSGSIFCDYRCYKDIMMNYNTILYGHNMLNGTMFNDVTKFLDPEFFANNKYIKIYTLDGIFTYEVFSVYETEYDYPYITTAFQTRPEFVEFAERVRDNSKNVREGIEFGETDRILTLSTCTNGFWTGRYALHALLVNVVK